MIKRKLYRKKLALIVIISGITGIGSNYYINHKNNKEDDLNIDTLGQRIDSYNLTYEKNYKKEEELNNVIPETDIVKKEYKTINEYLNIPEKIATNEILGNQIVNINLNLTEYNDNINKINIDEETNTLIINTSDYDSIISYNENIKELTVTKKIRGLGSKYSITDKYNFDDEYNIAKAIEIEDSYKYINKSKVNDIPDEYYYTREKNLITNKVEKVIYSQNNIINKYHVNIIKITLTTIDDEYILTIDDSEAKLSSSEYNFLISMIDSNKYNNFIGNHRDLVEYYLIRTKGGDKTRTLKKIKDLEINKNVLHMNN